MSERERECVSEREKGRERRKTPEGLSEIKMSLHK